MASPTPQTPELEVGPPENLPDKIASISANEACLRDSDRCQLGAPIKFELPDVTHSLLPTVRIETTSEKSDPATDDVVKRTAGDVKGFVWRGDYPTDSYKGDKTLTAADDFKAGNSDAHDYMSLIETGKGHYKWAFGPNGLTVDSMNSWLKGKGVDTDHLDDKSIAAIEDKDIAAVAKFASVAGKLDASKGWGNNTAEEKAIADAAEKTMDDAPLLSAKLQDQIVADLGQTFAKELKGTKTEGTGTLDEGTLDTAMLLGHVPADADKTGNENIMQFSRLVDDYRKQNPTGDMDPDLVGFAIANGWRLPKDDKEFADYKELQRKQVQIDQATDDEEVDGGSGRHRNRRNPVERRTSSGTTATTEGQAVILGDSLVYGLNKGDMQGVTASGIIGEGADHLASRISKKDLKGKTVGIWIGTNDLGNGIGSDDTDVANRVEAAVEAARNAGAQHIVLAAIPHRGNSYTLTYGGEPVPTLNRRVDDINNRLASWAKSQSNVTFTDISVGFNPNDPRQSVDGLHLRGVALAQARARMLTVINSVSTPSG